MTSRIEPMLPIARSWLSCSTASWNRHHDQDQGGVDELESAADAFENVANVVQFHDAANAIGAQSPRAHSLHVLH